MKREDRRMLNQVWVAHLCQLNLLLEVGLLLGRAHHKSELPDVFGGVVRMWSEDAFSRSAFSQVRPAGSDHPTQDANCAWIRADRVQLLPALQSLLDLGDWRQSVDEPRQCAPHVRLGQRVEQLRFGNAERRGDFDAGVSPSFRRVERLTAASTASPCDCWEQTPQRERKTARDQRRSGD